MQDLWNVHVVYPISTDVFKPSLHFRVAWGHLGTRTYVHITYIYVYIDRGHVEFNRRGSCERHTFCPPARRFFAHQIAAFPVLAGKHCSLQ